MDAFLIEHGGTFMKEQQAILPFQFAVRYYVIPFLMGMAVTWSVYATVRYIAEGFTS